MTTLNVPLILLIISIASIVLLIFYILSKRPLVQLQKGFLAMLLCVSIIAIGVLLQDLLSTTNNIDPIYFEYFINFILPFYRIF